MPNPTYDAFVARCGLVETTHRAIEARNPKDALVFVIENTPSLHGLSASDFTRIDRPRLGVDEAMNFAFAAVGDEGRAPVRPQRSPGFATRILLNGPDRVALYGIKPTLDTVTKQAGHMVLEALPGRIAHALADNGFTPPPYEIEQTMRRMLKTVPWFDLPDDDAAFRRIAREAYDRAGADEAKADGRRER